MNQPEPNAVDGHPSPLSVSHSTLLILLATAIVLVWYSHKPLYHSDLWGHLSYGRWMWERGQLPETEPLMPLAHDVPMIASAWLTQLVGFFVVECGGHHGLQFGYGLLVSASFAFVCLAVARRSGSPLWAVVSGAVFIFVLRWQLVIIRPQLVGLCCFTGLVWVLESERFDKPTGFIVTTLFVVWANAHPSFPAGLILLTLHAGTRFCAKVTSGRKAFADSRLLWLIVFGLSAGLAVMLNPYGFAAYPETFRVSANPNLHDLRDWQAPDLSSKFAVGYLLSVPLVITTALISRQRRWELLIATTLAGIATFFSKRMLCWYAVLSAVSIGVHAANRFGHGTRSPRRYGPLPVLCAGVIVFASSSLWRACFPAYWKPLAEVAAPSTPAGAVEFLVKNYEGDALVWAPNTWGDFVTWRSNAQIPVMVNSHAHLVPRDVWLDYRSVSTAKGDCIAVLDSRGIGWVVVDRRRQRLRGELERSPEWTTVFGDDRSVVFRRTRSQGSAIR